MLNAENFKTITQLRLNTTNVISTVCKDKKPVYILLRSRPQAVLLCLEEYGRLLDLKRENQKLKELLDRKSEGK